MNGGARIRLQVWTDETTGKTYVALGAQLSPEGALVYLVGDGELRRVLMPMVDYVALPYYYFESAGPAPRPLAAHGPRPVC